MAHIDDFDYANPISVFKILVLFFLNFVLECYFSGLLYIFILCAAFLFCLWNSWVAHLNIFKSVDADESSCTQSVRRNTYEGNYYTESVDFPVVDTNEVKLTIEDVKSMMEDLDRAHDNTENRNLGLNTEIEGLFEEELSLEEVKKAFDLYDENDDGFIDAEDLKKVLCAIGFAVASEVDQCQRMISAFDNNGDGRLDFVEFAKLVEQSFR